MQCSQRGRLPAEGRVHQRKYLCTLLLPCVNEIIVSVTQDKVEAFFYSKQPLSYKNKI